MPELLEKAAYPDCWTVLQAHNIHKVRQGGLQEGIPVNLVKILKLMESSRSWLTFMLMSANLGSSFVSSYTHCKT